MNNRAGSDSCKICFSIYNEDPPQLFSQIETNFMEFFFFFHVSTNYSGSIRSFTCCLKVTHISSLLKIISFTVDFFFQFSYITSVFWLLKLNKSSKQLPFAGGFPFHIVTLSTFACSDHYQKSIFKFLFITDIKKKKRTHRKHSMYEALLLKVIYRPWKQVWTPALFLNNSAIWGKSLNLSKS